MCRFCTGRTEKKLETLVWRLSCWEVAKRAGGEGFPKWRAMPARAARNWKHTADRIHHIQDEGRERKYSTVSTSTNTLNRM